MTAKTTTITLTHDDICDVDDMMLIDIQFACFFCLSHVTSSISMSGGTRQIDTTKWMDDLKQCV